MEDIHHALYMRPKALWHISEDTDQVLVMVFFYLCIHCLLFIFEDASLLVIGINIEMKVIFSSALQNNSKIEYILRHQI